MQPARFVEPTDPVEAAFAEAILAATAAGRFDVVGQIVRELEQRRASTSTSATVVPLASRRRK